MRKILTMAGVRDALHKRGIIHAVWAKKTHSRHAAGEAQRAVVLLFRFHGTRLLRPDSAGHASMVEAARTCPVELRYHLARVRSACPHDVCRSCNRKLRQAWAAHERIAHGNPDRTG